MSAEPKFNVEVVNAHLQHHAVAMEPLWTEMVDSIVAHGLRDRDDFEEVMPGQFWLKEIAPEGEYVGLSTPEGTVVVGADVSGPTVNDVLDLIDSDVAGIFGLIHRIVWNGAIPPEVPGELLEGLTGTEAVALSNLILLSENANWSNSATWSITVSYRVARLYLWYLNTVVAHTDPAEDPLLQFIEQSHEALIRQVQGKYESPRKQFDRNQIGYRFTDRDDTVRVTVVVGLILSKYELERYEKTLREITADHGYNHFRGENELLRVRAYHVGRM